MIFQVTLRPYYEQEDYGSHSTYECNTLEECILYCQKTFPFEVVASIRDESGITLYEDLYTEE